MSRRNIGDLGPASPAHRPSSPADRLKGRFKFETRTEAAAEDEVRHRMLLSSTHLSRAAEAEAATELAERLAEGDARGGWPETLASARYLREVRDRVGGATSEQVYNTSDRTVTFTVIPRGWSLSPEELAVADPKKLIAGFRADLSRCGAKEADGWAILGLHGEFDPGKVRYQLHLHGVAVGGMIDVVDRLGDRPKYASSRLGDRADDGVTQRVRVSRKPLTNLPSPLTYILQPFWPSRWSGDIGAGVISRQRTKHRIPEPYHTQYLLWLDQWSLNDITLLMKLRVQKDGLTVK